MNFEFKLPRGSRSQFEKTIHDVIQRFPENEYCLKLESGKLEMKDYHKLLCGLFFQVYHSSNSFSGAGSKFNAHRVRARDYLIKHAEEEKTHWEWILNDLKSTAYPGKDITSEHPPASTAAYIAFNYFIADEAPIARLGIALMLETLGATFGKKYATLLCTSLNLKPNQASFFFGHGDTDVGHTKELWEVIDQCNLTPEEWSWMAHAATVAFELYSRIYRDVVR